MSNNIEINIAATANDDWKFWCRLCAKEDAGNINVFSGRSEVRSPENSNCGNSKVIVFIEEFFRVRIERDKSLPHWICTKCYSLVSNLVKFTNQIKMVQSMYEAIQHYGETQILDLRMFREKYNLFGDEFLLFQSLDKKPAVEKVYVSDATEIMDGVVKTEIISDETESGLIFNEVEYKTEFQDPISDVTQNMCSEEEESPNQRNSTNDGKRIKSEKGVAVKPYSQQHVVKKLKKGNLDKRLCFAGEEAKEHKFFCSDCSMHFQRISNYRIHMKKKHGRADKLDPFICPDCSRAFETRSELIRHIKTHRPLSEKRIFPCPQCERKFQTKDYVARHIKFVHEDIRPFICEECGEGTRTEATLREHMLIHTNDTPFECEICQKRFKNQTRRKTHMEIHSSNKHICSECGLQLNSRVTLNRHMLVHSDIMRHKCDYCGRAFKRAKTLKNHLILHSGLKPYSCDFCDKTFASGPNCRTHKRKSHPEELAALEASGGKSYTRNIPKLAVLKNVTRSAENLTPVVTKHSGNFSLGRKPNTPPECITSTKIPNSLPGVDELVATPPSCNMQIIPERDTSDDSKSLIGINMQLSSW